MLFVLLHGHDATATNLHPAQEALFGCGHRDITVVDGWCELPDGNRAWWDDAGPVTRPGHAVRLLREFVAAQLEERNLDWTDLVLVGFSQGAALALGLGCDRTAPSPHAVACIAGFAPDGFSAAEAGMRELLVVHGDDDDVVDPMYGDVIARQARKAGVAVMRVNHEGGHTWTRSCTDALLSWVRQIGGAPARPTTG